MLQNDPFVIVPTIFVFFGCSDKVTTKFRLSRCNVQWCLRHTYVIYPTTGPLLGDFLNCCHSAVCSLRSAQAPFVSMQGVASSSVQRGARVAHPRLPPAPSHLRKDAQAPTDTPESPSRATQQKLEAGSGQLPAPHLSGGWIPENCEVETTAWSSGAGNLPKSQKPDDVHPTTRNHASANVQDKLQGVSVLKSPDPTSVQSGQVVAVLLAIPRGTRQEKGGLERYVRSGRVKRLSVQGDAGQRCESGCGFNVQPCVTFPVDRSPGSVPIASELCQWQTGGDSTPEQQLVQAT
jgi:hypothetical protein